MLLARDPVQNLTGNRGVDIGRYRHVGFPAIGKGDEQIRLVDGGLHSQGCPDLAASSEN